MKASVAIPLTMVSRGTELPHIELEDRQRRIC